MEEENAAEYIQETQVIQVTVYSSDVQDSLGAKKDWQTI